MPNTCSNCLHRVLLWCICGNAMAGVWDVTISPASGSVSVYADVSVPPSQTIMNITVWQNVSHNLLCSIVNSTPTAAKSYYTLSPSVIASSTTQGYCELSLSSSLPYSSAGGGGSNLLQLQLLDLQNDQIIDSFSYKVLVQSPSTSTAVLQYVPPSTVTSWIYTPSGTAVTIVTTLLTAALVTSITVVICRSCTANPLLEAGETVAVVEHVHVPPLKQTPQELSYSYSQVARPQSRNSAPILEKHKWETGTSSIQANVAESEFRKPPQTAVVI